MPGAPVPQLPACSVTGLAALLLTLGALLFEGASLVAAGRHGVLGWAADLHYLPYVLYLAVVPGIVGHTGGLLGGCAAAAGALQPQESCQVCCLRPAAPTCRVEQC